MGRTACTEPQCLYKGDLYLTLPFTSSLKTRERERERETATTEESLRRVWSCAFDVFLLYAARYSLNFVKHSRRSTYELL